MKEITITRALCEACPVLWCGNRISHSNYSTRRAIYDGDRRKAPKPECYILDKEAPAHYRQEP